MKQKKIKVQYKSRATARGYASTPMIQPSCWNTMNPESESGR